MLHPITYILYLPAKLEHVHSIFSISQLKKYVLDPNYAIVTKFIEVIKNLDRQERPTQILDNRVEKLCNKSNPLVKVLWANRTSFEATGRWKRI